MRLGTTLKAVYTDHVVLSDDSRVDTRTVAWVTGVTPSPLIATLGLETERGRVEGAGRSAGTRPLRRVRRGDARRPFRT